MISGTFSCSHRLQSGPLLRPSARPVRLAAQADASQKSNPSSKGRTGRTVRRAAAVEDAPTTKRASKQEEEPSYVSQTDKYAVIEAGGVQHLVEENRLYSCNRLQAEPGSRIRFPRVLALKKDGNFKVGRPYLDNVQVEAQIVDNYKAPKVIVFKMRAKKHYRSKNGHRQTMTKFLVTKIHQD